MNKVYLFLIALSLVFTSSCEKTELQEDFQTDVELKSAHMKMTRNFRAHLSSDQEVPPVESMATGQAIFQLSKDGETLGYKLIVANIEDVLAAHIHMAPVGASAGVVVALYTGGLISGKTNGILAEGEITADDLVGALVGMELKDLLDKMEWGQTYVNVHTVMYPGGEIRGQISGGK